MPTDQQHADFVEACQREKLGYENRLAQLRAEVKLPLSEAGLTRRRDAILALEMQLRDVQESIEIATKPKGAR
jgi:hypothetical protein